MQKHGIYYDSFGREAKASTSGETFLQQASSM